VLIDPLSRFPARSRMCVCALGARWNNCDAEGPITGCAPLITFRFDDQESHRPRRPQSTLTRQPFCSNSSFVDLILKMFARPGFLFAE